MAGGIYMSKADSVFCGMCHNILWNGVSTEGEKVRPKWEDGEFAYTKKVFGVVNRYDLSKEFPILTIRPVPIRLCTDEILWIYSRKSNVVSELNSGIWDSWKTDDGTIGDAYGYQIGKVSMYRDITIDGLKKAFPNGVLKEHYEEEFLGGYSCFCDEVYERDYGCPIYHVVDLDDDGFWFMDQMDRVLYDLVNTPFSRRIITNMYNHSELFNMALYPCAYSMTFNVTTDIDGKFVLNGILNQRSQDVLVANGWNVAQYAVLMHMIARHCDMGVGELVHVIADAHIYDRHIHIIRELIGRKQYDAPKFYLNPNKKDFYSFTVEDVKLVDYKHGEQILHIPVAV